MFVYFLIRISHLCSYGDFMTFDCLLLCLFLRFIYLFVFVLLLVCFGDVCVFG